MIPFNISTTADGHTLSGVLDLTPPARPEPMRLGLSFAPADMAVALAENPDIGILRHFGVDYDKDGRPELPDPRTDPRWRAVRAVNKRCRIHCSYKDDVEQVSRWLDIFGLLDPVDLEWLEIVLTWYHEAHGDVDPPTYRLNASRMAQLVAAHPMGHLVVANGPAVTRYALEHGLNPDDFMYPEANTFIVDAYKPDAMTSYPDGGYMFDQALEYGARRGVTVRAAEVGSGLIPGDTGAGRAKAMRGWATYARDAGMADWCWWNNNKNKLTDVAGWETLKTLVATQAR